MRTQAQVSSFLKRRFQSTIEPARRSWLAKGKLCQLTSLGNLLLAMLLVGGLSLNAWGAPVAFAQASSNGRVAVIGVNNAALYATPGGATLQTLTPGTPVTVTGRSQDSQWIQVDDSILGKGWMAAQQLIVFGVDSLPVVAVASATVA